MFVHANKKRSAKSFPGEYYRDKTKRVNTRAEGDDGASVFSDATEPEPDSLARSGGAGGPAPKRPLPSIVEEEDDSVVSTILPLQDEPTFKTPVESVRASRSGSSSDIRSEAGERYATPKAAPSILPQGDVNLNVNFNRNRYKRPNVDPEYYDNKSYTYVRSKQTDKRDLYFVKLVAGALGKRFLDMVEIIDTGEDAATAVIQSTYKYNDVLLKAWSGAMEMVKRMIEPSSLGRWRTSEECYAELAKDDTFIDALAEYVAYKISNRNRGAIVRGKTRYEFANDDRVEDILLIAIMRPLHYTYGILEQELVDDYF
jgi:hypothetical protein